MSRSILLLCGIFFYCIALQAQVITTVGGNGTMGYSGDGSPATAAEFDFPRSIATDTSGNLYISDGNSCIRKVNSSGIISTIAGNGTLGHSGDGGPASAAILNNANGVATDDSGNIYITELYYIRKINSSGIISTICGTGVGGHSGDGGPATAARLFANPWGILADSSGNIYFTEEDSSYIRKIDHSGIITTIAGTGIRGYSGDGIPATTAMLNYPVQLALDPAGNIYFADQGNNRVRKIDKAGMITTVAGNGSGGYSGDGSPATAAEINGPQGLFIDVNGNMYIGEGGNHRVRKVNTAGIISTIAGNGFGGYGGDGGCATAASFYQALSLAMSKKGDLYLSDWNYNRVRMIIHDRVPTFTAGNKQALYICGNTVAVSINALLAVLDSDAGKTDEWQMITPPAHGSIVATYSATSTGSIITPTGLSYTPTTGYIGYDTFIVAVMDCGGMADTTTLYVRIDTLPPYAGAITGADSVCMGSLIALSDTVAGGVWNSSNVYADVSGGVVSGVAPGRDTLLYILKNGCGSDTAVHVVDVNDCKEEASPLPSPQMERVSLYPNPNNGEFAVTVSSGSDDEASVVITNVVGEKVKEFSMPVNKTITVRLGQPNGIYFMSVVVGSGRYVGKVVLE